MTGPLEVAHGGLRSLTIKDWYGSLTECVLHCPLLDDLKIDMCKFHDAMWKVTISSCPRLMKVEVTWDMVAMDEEDVGPLIFKYETVEELVLRNLARQIISIACEKLRRLLLTWLPEAPSKFPQIACLNLTSLELDGYPYLLPNLPSLLLALPALEIIKIFCFRENVSQVTLEHDGIRDVVIGKSQKRKGYGILDIIMPEFELTLMMPSLFRVDVEKSSVQVLKVGARERTTLQCVIVHNGCDVIEL